MRTFNFTRVASVVCAALTALAVPALSASAQFNVPSDGSDGAFNPGKLPYLFAYGSGGGSYTSAGGIGTTADFPAPKSET